MKRGRTNICRFVENIPEGQILTENFVYETEPETMSKMHMRNKNILFLVASGCGTLTVKERRYSLTEGMMCFVFSGEYFKIEPEKNLEYFYITFSGDRTQELFKRFSVSQSNFVFWGNEGLISLWKNSIARANDKNIDLISESLLLYTFSQLVPIEKSKDERLIDSILTYVDMNFTDFKLNLSQMSDELGYNSKYISRIFKQSIGMNFSEYLKHTRINHAVFLLEQGITSVKNAALLSGYSDPLYFSSVFKKVMGISASEFIKLKNKDLVEE